MSYKVLIADDEMEIRNLLRLYLENDGFTVEDVATGEEVAGAMASFGPDVVLLDVMMPGKDGIHVLKDIREVSNVPVMIISARTADAERILGLNVGADDYICKPFRISEVLVRVKAVIRRNAKTVDEEISNNNISFNGLELNKESKRAYIDGVDISLTKKEFEVLCMLMSRPGKVYSRDEILANVWPDDVNVLERSIDVNMARLRKKLGEYANNVVSRSGYGYCFVNE